MALTVLAAGSGEDDATATGAEGLEVTRLQALVLLFPVLVEADDSDGEEVEDVDIRDGVGQSGPLTAAAFALEMLVLVLLLIVCCCWTC